MKLILQALIYIGSIFWMNLPFRKGILCVCVYTQACTCAHVTASVKTEYDL